MAKGLSEYRRTTPPEWSLEHAITDPAFFEKYEQGDAAIESNRYGKSVSGFAKFVPPEERYRDLKAQREAGGEDRQATDHGGDLLAISMGGRSTADNLVPMAAKLNQGLFKHTELSLLSKLKQGEDVYVEITAYNNDDSSQRPDLFTYNWVSRDNEGLMDCGFHTFTNEYPYTMEELDAKEVSALVEEGIEMVLEEEFPEEAECPDLQELCSDSGETVPEGIDEATLEALAAEFDDME